MNLLYFIIVLYIIILCVFFILGYIIGQLSNNTGVSYLRSQKAKIHDKVSVNNIDDTKFVVKIKTDELEKKYTELGETKSSEENITNSVSKLKNMKG